MTPEIERVRRNQEQLSAASHSVFFCILSNRMYFSFSKRHSVNQWTPVHLGMLSHSHTLEGIEYDSCVSQEVCIMLSYSRGLCPGCWDMRSHKSHIVSS